MDKTTDEIDKLFFDYFNTNQEIPDIIENGIRSVALEEIYHKSKIILYIKKIIITIIGIATVTGGVVFAKDIEKVFKKFFGTIPSEGVDTAINNGYLAKLNTDYKEGDGIHIKVDSMLMDDINLCINFIVSLDDKYNIEDFKNNEISFDDLKIVDETGKIIFITHPYDNEHCYMGSYAFTKNLIEERTFRISFVATNYSNAFSRSKKLFVNFNILNNNVIDSNYEIQDNLYKGMWNFKIDVPEEFYNRETIIYKVRNSNLQELKGVEATLTNTMFTIYIPEIITDKIEYTSELNMGNSLSWKPFEMAYVETSEGNKYESYYGIEGSSRYSKPFNENKIIGYHQAFNLTQYDSTDILKVYIITNKNQEIVLELERNK